MTVIESGTAVNVHYNDTDARAVAIHEAGHAAAAHVYVPEVESSRLSIKMRGQSLGHHQSFEKEERFGAFQSRMFGELIHAVGAMAAELVFYGENSVGVGGDLMTTTWTATGMVGAAGMSPLPLELHGKTFADETEEQTRERVLKRLEDIGSRLMNKTSDGWQSLADPRKRAYAAQFIGEAFVTAYNLILENKDKVEKIANTILEEKEIYGDDLVRLLDEQNFQRPEIDWTDEAVWPKFMNWTRDDAKTATADKAAATTRPAAGSVCNDAKTATPADGQPVDSAGPRARRSGRQAATRRGSRVIYAALGVVLVGALVGLGVLATGSSRPRRRPPPAGRPGSRPTARPRRWPRRSPITSPASTT